MPDPPDKARLDFDANAKIIDDNPEGWQSPEDGARWIKSHPNTITRTYESVKLDPTKVEKIPGLSGEHEGLALAQRQDDIAKLAEDMKARGYQGYPIAINVYPDGSVKIYEGNRRVRAAVRAGLTEIPVDVRYIGGAERRTSVHPLDYAKDK